MNSFPCHVLRNGCAASLLAFATATASAADVIVFAAASLSSALDDVAAAWEATTGETVILSYAGTSALARQIEEGAPADVFIAADTLWMDYLAEGGFIETSSRQALLGNSLVLVAAESNSPPLSIEPGLDLANLLEGGRLAVAETSSVPAGRYAAAALASLGIWDSVSDQLAEAESVRTALAYVALGEAPYGIVYATDARAEPAVTVVGTFPPESHPPIVYPMALTTEADNHGATSFFYFLNSEAAVSLFERHGFNVLANQSASAYAR